MANAARPSTARQPTTPSSDLGPHGPQRESESPALPAAVEQQRDDREAADDAEDPGQGPADRTLGPTADELEVGSRPETAAPLERYQTTPRIDSSPPRVTMKEGTPT